MTTKYQNFLIFARCSSKLPKKWNLMRSGLQSGVNFSLEETFFVYMFYICRTAAGGSWKVKIYVWKDKHERANLANKGPIYFPILLFDTHSQKRLQNDKFNSRFFPSLFIFMWTVHWTSTATTVMIGGDFILMRDRLAALAETHNLLGRSSYRSGVSTKGYVQSIEQHSWYTHTTLCLSFCKKWDCTPHLHAITAMSQKH